MTLFTFNPLADQRWLELLEQRSDASVFHTREWLEALQRTYAFEPVVITTSPPGIPLTSGIAFSRVNSWLTGDRLVSLPFTDHCQPLVNSPEELRLILQQLPNEVDRKCSYIEVRPLVADSMPSKDCIQFSESDRFHHHSLDLRPELDHLFRAMHQSCIQRKIRRAQREELAYEEGRSDDVLKKFYYLLLLTRRRHAVPPQPIHWFRNLARCFGERFTIRIASKSGMPIASIITLRYKKTVVYKYGCSDARFHRLGGMQLLFWRTICDAKGAQCEQMDLGRSDLSNHGLNAFKLHFGARCEDLQYYRFPSKTALNLASWPANVVAKVVSRLPDLFFVAAGNLLYRHVG